MIRDAKLRREIRAALSQQAEPAPAQDEREAVERFSPTTSVPYCGRTSEVEAYMAEDDDGEYMTVAQHERIVASLTRPAQTEQQPVAWVSSGPDGVEADWYPGKGLDTLPIGAKLYADPIAQTEQQPVRLPERKRTDHLPKEYKTMTVVRAGLEAYNRALDDVAALNAAPIAQTEQQPVGWQSIVLHASELADMVLKGDAPQTAQRTARALLSMLAAPIAQTAPQPEQSELVEALKRIWRLMADREAQALDGSQDRQLFVTILNIADAALSPSIPADYSCDYAGCSSKAHPGTSLCLAHHSPKDRAALSAQRGDRHE